MPPLPAVSNTVRVALIGTLDTDADVVDRFYLSYFTGTPPTSLNSLCVAIAARWATDLKAQYGSSFTLTAVEAEDLTTSTSPVGATTVATVGTRAGSKISASACALLRFHIGRRYRGGHPRIYLPAGTSNDLTNEQQWSAAFLSGLVTAWTTFIGHAVADANTAYGATDFRHVNVSYYAGFTNVTYPSGRTYPRPTLRATPLVDSVTSYTANPNVASQRRRNLTP